MTNPLNQQQQESYANLPSEHRQQHGDVRVFEPGDERGGLFTSQTDEHAKKPYKCNFKLMISRQVLTAPQVADCIRYAYLWEIASLSNQASAQKIREKTDGTGAINYDKPFTDHERYLEITAKLRDNSQAWLYHIVLEGLSFTNARRKIGGNNNTAKARFVMAVEDLGRAFDYIYMLDNACA